MIEFDLYIRGGRYWVWGEFSHILVAYYPSHPLPTWSWEIRLDLSWHKTFQQSQGSQSFLSNQWTSLQLHTRRLSSSHPRLALKIYKKFHSHSHTNTICCRWSDPQLMTVSDLDRMSTLLTCIEPAEPPRKLVDLDNNISSSKYRNYDVAQRNTPFEFSIKGYDSK